MTGQISPEVGFFGEKTSSQQLVSLSAKHTRGFIYLHRAGSLVFSHPHHTALYFSKVVIFSVVVVKRHIAFSFE